MTLTHCGDDDRSGIGKRSLWQWSGNVYIGVTVTPTKTTIALWITIALGEFSDKKNDRSRVTKNDRLFYCFVLSHFPKINNNRQFPTRMYIHLKIICECQYIKQLKKTIANGRESDRLRYEVKTMTNTFNINRNTRTI